MRRRPGISGLQRDVVTRGAYKAVGQHVNATRVEVMRGQLETFRRSLEEFAVKHRADIRQDPVFRAQFHQMCANAGVDPLASNKGAWAQLLGFGDFYYHLGVQCVEACLATRAVNGGLMELAALRKHVQRRRGSVAEPVSEDDVIRAIEKLQVLGGGFAVVKIGNKKYVRSVPGELNTDKNRVLELAQAKGYVSLAQLQDQTGWTQLRAEEVLSGMLREGLAMIDDGVPQSGTLYWFPCTGVGDT